MLCHTEHFCACDDKKTFYICDLNRKMVLFISLWNGGSSFGSMHFLPGGGGGT